MLKTNLKTTKILLLILKIKHIAIKINNNNFKNNIL